MLVALLFAGHLQANLGDTRAEAEAKYGKPATVEKGRTDKEVKCLYSHGGYKITVKYLDGKSHFEEYTKEDLTNFAFTDDEIQTLLKANCLGLVWNRLRSTEKESMFEKNWELATPDKTVAAASTKHPYSKLTIATSEYIHYNSGYERIPNEKAEPVEP